MKSKNSGKKSTSKRSASKKNRIKSVKSTGKISNAAKIISAKEKQDAILGELKVKGGAIYNDLINGKFPNFLIPSRSTSNIVYDETLRQYILGSAAALRNSKNTSQLRSFTQLIWLAFFANRLTNEKKLSTSEILRFPGQWSLTTSIHYYGFEFFIYLLFYKSSKQTAFFYCNDHLCASID